MKKKFGFTFIGLTAITILFQVVIILGAPLGAYTQGGTTDGVLSAPGRISAAVSVLLLVILAFVVALKADIVKARIPKRLLDVGFWFAIFSSLVAFTLNWITPSLPERLVWGPVTTVMLACVVGIALLSRKNRAK